MASKLFVGGLPYAAISEDLREYFAQCGTVMSATVITDRVTGQSRGFGFVEMSTEAEAQAAIAKLNGQSLQGRRLTVNAAERAGHAVDRFAVPGVPLRRGVRNRAASHGSLVSAAADSPADGAGA